MPDLNIRVINNMKETINFMLYQSDINLNVKNFQIGAWRHDSLAPNAVYTTVLPQDITISATETSDIGTIITKSLGVDYNDSIEIFDNNSSIDIQYGTEIATENTIDVYNKCGATKTIIAQKDSRPLFKCNLRPDYKLNFSINPKVYIALCDYEISSDFFDAASLSEKLEVDYDGQSYLTITLSENQSSGEVSFNKNFDKY